ncbi:MAG: hypothetical protein HQL72_05925 [Magnetococcales bacterium]|nr:hypothetical protein [Magnetococcales bacterium]
MTNSIQMGQQPLSAQAMHLLSQEQIQAILQTPDSSFDLVAHQFKESLQWMDTWEKEHREIIYHLAEAQDAQEQIIAIRKESLTLIENCTITQPFLREGLTDEEVALLLGHRHPDLSLEEATQAQYQLYLFSHASLRCLRRLSAACGDSSSPWYELCFEIHQQHIGHLYRQTLAHLTGNEYNFESLVPLLQQMIDEVEAKVLDGKPWDFARKLQDVRQFEKLQHQSGPLDGGRC